MSIGTQKTIACVALIVLLFGAPREAEAVLEVFQVNAGNDSYRQGEFEDSIEKYKQALKNNSESDIINFNLGSAYYKKGEYVKALEHLRKSVLTEDAALREQAFYNSGNTLYQSGRLFLEEKDLKSTIQFYEEALKEYEKAMQLNPDDADARHNYEYVTKELEKLKQQQKQQQDQQQQDQQQQNQQQQDQQQQNQQQQDQQQQNQQQQDQQQQNQQQQDQQQQDQQQQDQQQQDQQQQDQQQDNQPPSTQDQAPANYDDLTQNEAQMLLQDYQQNEEPKGLLQFRPRVIPEPVVKDW